MRMLLPTYQTAGIALFAVAWLAPSNAQTASDKPPAGDGAQGHAIYVERFGQNRPLPVFGDVSETAATLLRLRMVTIPGLRVEYGTAPPQCASPQSGIGPTEAAGNRTAAAPAFYTASGYIEVAPAREGRFEVLLGYKLFRCENSKSTEVYRNSSQFPETGLYEALHNMSDVLGIRLEREVTQRVAVRVGPFETSDRTAKAREVADNFSDFLANRIDSSEEFVAADTDSQPNTMAVTGTFRFKSGGKAFDLAAVVKSAGESKVLPLLSGSTADLRSFSRSAAPPVYQALLDLAARTRSANEDPLSAARSLLCLPKTQSANCTPKPKVAAALLDKLTDKEIPRHERLQLQGNAAFADGDYERAANYAEQSVSLSPKDRPAWRMQSIQNVAEAWSAAGNHKKAADSYRQLFAEMATIPEAARASLPDAAVIRQQWARSLQLSGSRLEALDVLVAAAPKGAALSRDLHDSIANLLGNLAPSEVGPALDKVSGTLPKSDKAYVTLLRQAANAALTDDLDYRKAIRLFGEFAGILEFGPNPDQPALAVALNQLGLAYYHSDDMEHAGIEFQRSYDIEKPLAISLSSRAVTIENLAYVRQVQEKYDAAEALMREALGERRKEAAAHPAAYVDCLGYLVGLYVILDRRLDAETAYQEAADFVKKVPPQDKSSLGASWLSLGRIAHGAGKISAAESSMQRAVTALSAQSGADDRKNLDAATLWLARIYDDEGKVTDALKIYEEAVKQAEADAHTPPATLIRRWTDAAGIHTQMSNFQRSEILAGKALKLARDTESLRNTWSEASAYLELADAYRWNGRFANALEQYELAMKIVDKLGKPEASGRSTYLNTLGQNLRELGRYQEALNRIQEAYRIRKRTWGPSTMAAASSLSHLGDLYRLTGDLPRAEQTQLEALAIRKALEGLDPALVARSERYLGEVYRDLQRYEEAEKHYREAVRLEESAGMAEYTEGQLTRARLADILRVTGKPAESSQLAASVYDRMSKLWPQHPYLAYACQTLGLLKASEKQYGEAERLLKQALDLRRLALPADHPLIAGTLQEHAVVLRAMGKAGDADKEEAEVREIGKRRPAGPQ